MEKTERNNSILVIIPCLNEEQNVLELNEKLNQNTIANCNLTWFFINDHSNDNTLKVLKQANLNYLDNPINLGIGGTVQLGFLYAHQHNFDIAVQMDGDGQHPPADLFRLIEPILKNETDVTIGSRFIENNGFQSTFFRRLGIYFFYYLNRILVGVKIKDATSGYRAFNQKAILELVEYYPDEYPEPESIVYLANKGIRMKEVPVVMQERFHGKSSIRSFSTVYYMIKVSLNTVVLHLKMKFNGNV